MSIFDRSFKEDKMGIFDTFKGNKYKKEVEELKKTFTPEMLEAEKIQELISKLQNDVNNLNTTIELRKKDIATLNNTATGLTNRISYKRTQLVYLDRKSTRLNSSH